MHARLPRFVAKHPQLYALTCGTRLERLRLKGFNFKAAQQFATDFNLNRFAGLALKVNDQFIGRAIAQEPLVLDAQLPIGTVSLCLAQRSFREQPCQSEPN